MIRIGNRLLDWEKAFLVVLGIWIVGSGKSRADDSRALEFFEKKVRPVLVTHCYRCHSAQTNKLKGGLQLDSRNGVLKGGDTGPAIVVGEPSKSRLVSAIRHENVELQMPPSGKLSDEIIADLTTWVRMGAPWPDETIVRAADAKPFSIADRRRAHWAWQPVQDRVPLSLQKSTWPLGTVDQYILAALDSKGLTPAPSVERRTLIRRLTFDLIGMPPSPEDVERFIEDRSPDAMIRVVDRLLASPHFGERWGRHWLDLVRYADTRGHEFDFPIPNAFQYRDYVIRALNEDVPYNMFVTEHLAGDLMRTPRLNPTAGFNESILGTGFWFLGEGVHSPVDIRQDEADRFDNMIDVMSKTFLGLTVSCARCHDHKFDAISTKDYYALSGYLKSGSYRQVRFETLEKQRHISARLESLKVAEGQTLRQRLYQSIHQGVERTADYLLAVREILLATDGHLRFRSTPVRWDSEVVSAIAHRRGLDTQALVRWADAVCAAKDPTDILYNWSRACRPSTRMDRKIIVLPKRADSHETAVVVDYAHLRQNQWMPDESAWGMHPTRPGDLRSGKPLSFVERGAAEIDPFWNQSRVEDEAEQDPTAFGGIVRAGRTIRTPSFQLDPSGRLHFLVRGTGRAYIAAGSYVLFDGPLHKSLLQPINAGNEFRWVSSNDLRAYAGQHVHVEFTAGVNFALAKVAQGEAPPSPIQPLIEIVQSGSDGDAISSESLAQSYQRAIACAVEHLNGADHAPLAGWLLKHRDLFMSPVHLAEMNETLRQTADRFTGLAEEVQRASHLAPAMWEGTGVNANVYIRGSHKSIGDQVPRRFLEALAGDIGQPSALGSGRLELALQMTDPTLNPFISRVIVNRIWHHMFGRGLVGSVDDFGVMGDAPTHRELLDHLAARFVDNGWSIKKLVRELALSRAYQMPAESNEANDRVDGSNHYLHRRNLRRLDAEAIRDATLAVSDGLDKRLFGKPVPVFLTDHQQGRGRPVTSGPIDGYRRRSIYLRVPRNFLTPMLSAFDLPSPFSTMGRRSVSNVPAQALILMNDPFVHQQAQRWADRMLREQKSTKERVDEMYLTAFARHPTATEIERCEQFIESRVTAESMSELEAWADLAHALFNAKEFIYLN